MLGHLAIIASISEAGMLILLLRLKMWRKLPLFCIYMGWTCLSDIGLIWANAHYPADYAKIYLYEASIDALLQLTVLVELAWSVLRPFRNTLPKSTLYVIAGIICIAALIIWPLSSMTVPSSFGGVDQTIFRLNSTVAVLRVGCFLVMACFSQLLGIGWRDRELQIATGLGFYSIVDLIVEVLHSHQVNGGKPYLHLDTFLSISYLCTLAYWVYSFATKEQERKEFSPQMQQFLLQMGGGARSSRMALTNLPQDRFKKKD